MSFDAKRYKSTISKIKLLWEIQVYPNCGSSKIVCKKKAEGFEI